MGDENREGPVALNLESFTHEAFHEKDGVLTIRDAELALLIHAKLVEAADAATKHTSVRVVIDVNPPHPHR